MKLESVTFQTNNLKERIQFYETVLGLKIMRDMRGKGVHDIVFMGNEETDTQIELIEEEEGYEGRHLSLGFHTDNVMTERERIVKMGLDPSPVISPEPGVCFFFVQDPNGMDIQFIQIDI